MILNVNVITLITNASGKMVIISLPNEMWNQSVCWSHKLLWSCKIYMIYPCDEHSVPKIFNRDTNSSKLLLKDMNLGFIKHQEAAERTRTKESLRPNMTLDLSFNLLNYNEETAKCNTLFHSSSYCRGGRWHRRQLYSLRINMQ